MHTLTVRDLSQCCSALFVGDGDVPVLRHRQVPGDTPSPGCIHRKHRGGPLSAQRPGTTHTLSPADQQEDGTLSLKVH